MANVYELIDNIFDEANFSAEAMPFNHDIPRCVIPTKTFKETEPNYNFTLEDREIIRKILLKNPEYGKVCAKAGVNFTGSLLYKMHVTINKHPDDGRVIYGYYPKFNRIYLFTLYSKSQDKDLSKAKYKALVVKSKQFQRYLERIHFGG